MSRKRSLQKKSWRILSEIIRTMSFTPDVLQLTTNDKFEKLLRTVDIFIVPNLNPDGYEFSRHRDRLWRKTRLLSMFYSFSYLRFFRDVDVIYEGAVN